MLRVVAMSGGDFTSIMEALAAPLLEPVSPLVILLRDGEYHEQVTITMPNVRLVGESNDRTILTWDGECPALRVEAPGVSVEHLLLKHSSEAPCNPDACRYEDCVTQQSDRQAPLDNTGDHPADPIPTWWVCGDSTSAICTPEWAPQANWTMIIPPLVQDRAHVQSYGKSGTSSKSFVQEGRLGAIELCIRPGDRLYVQFSHNDEKKPNDLFTESRRTFPLWLDMYIDMARMHGAEPILVTPFERRIVDEAGQLTYSHGDYPQAIREKALERGVRLVDMLEASRKLYLDTGLEESKRYFMWIEPGHPNFPEGSKDNTHFCREGAERLAELFLGLNPD